MGIIVQKYGGTSMANAECIKNVARRVIETKNRGHQVVVIVSAPAGLTDELTKKAKEISQQPNRRELDMILSTGEQVSISLLAMAIQSYGEQAISYTSAQVGIFTDENHTKAKIEDIKTERIQASLDAGNIVIIAGFQGVTKNLEITTLGRGGSDTSAVAMAVALKALEVEIYTDVAGIYTADPRIVPNAKKIERISFDEMLEMAGAGAKVLHLRSVELAAKNGMPIHLRSSFEETTGTYVTDEEEYMEQVLIKGVAHSVNNAKITLTNIKHTSENIAKIFRSISNANINVDVINQDYVKKDRVNVSFVVSMDEYEQALSICKQVGKEVQAESVTGNNQVSKVSIIGVGMKSTPGVAAKVFECLAENEVPIEMITTSDINITCIVPQRDYLKAVLAIHSAFEL